MTRNAELIDETAVDDALQLVVDEQDHIVETLTAYDRFAAGVSRLQANSPPTSGGATRSDGSGLQSVSSTVRHETTSDDSIRQLRELFAETVRPYSTDELDEPEPLFVTIREELGEEIAVVLSPSTDSWFITGLKQTIFSAVDQCQSELGAMNRGLEIEAESLRTARSVSETVTESLTADHPRLSELEFERLSQRHERLANHRRRCEQLAVDRQTTLHETTNHAVSAALSQEILVEYLYQPLSTGYPILSTVAQLADLCTDSQRTVRDQFTRQL